MYTYSRTPEPPKQEICAANKTGLYRFPGPHEPLDMVGSDMRGIGFNISCDDGGMMSIWPCRLCGLMYYRSMNMEEHILHEIKSDHRKLAGKLSEEYLKARVIPSGGVDDTQSKFDAILRKLVENGTLTRTDQDERHKPGTVVYVWNGKP